MINLNNYIFKYNSIMKKERRNAYKVKLIPYKINIKIGGGFGKDSLGHYLEDEGFDITYQFKIKILK